MGILTFSDVIILFKGHLSDEIDDNFDKPWIFNKTHYSLLQKLKISEKHSTLKLRILF
jgi:hypothetical protein